MQNATELTVFKRRPLLNLIFKCQGHIENTIICTFGIFWYILTFVKLAAIWLTSFSVLAVKEKTCRWVPISAKICF